MTEQVQKAAEHLNAALSPDGDCGGIKALLRMIACGHLSSFETLCLEQLIREVSFLSVIGETSSDWNPILDFFVALQEEIDRRQLDQHKVDT